MMIVSGFTRREKVVDTSIQDMKGHHSHCVLCRQVNCKQFVDNVTACEMSTCPNCNWRFHACKSEEHALTCQESRVACVNAGNGCPHTIKRSQMAQHLPVCPASVVSCSEEWCRWPMHAREQGVRHSLPPTKTYLECGQLDVGLAMRDQRMLIDSLKAPRKLKHSLRNPLTQKYPAVPFAHRDSSSHDSDPRASGDTSQTVSDDETDAPWDLNKLHPGLKESIRSQLYQVSKATTDQLATALNSTSEVLSNNTDGEETGAHITTEGHGETVDKNCGTDENKDGKDAEKESSAGENNKDTVRSSVSSDCISDMSRSRSVSVLRDVGGTQLHKITGEKLVDGSDDEISLHKILGVNLTYEVINKYVKKPASMYTFICAQNFRRDEYKWHFKNVHQEIHQGFNGWTEQRCPLAYQGCTFSFQRLIPEQPGVVLYHSWLQESYGLKSLAQPIHLQAEKDSQLNSPVALDSDTSTKALSSLHIDGKTDVPANAPEQRQQQQQPSISDLGHFDRDFDFVQPPVSSRNSSVGFAHDSAARSRNESDGDASSLSRSCYSESGRESEERESMMSVRPVVFTACNPDSKVLFQYNVEENQRRVSFLSPPALTGLPFEILQLIASHLDSFSLCNLSLTCRRLREVCCSLLDDHGIVLLNWERENNGDKVSWKVSNKRWMFSTSFEPIKKWKFNPHQPSVSDHLKSCPYNQDCNTHSEPIQIIFT